MAKKSAKRTRAEEKQIKSSKNRKSIKKTKAVKVEVDSDKNETDSDVESGPNL